MTSVLQLAMSPVKWDVAKVHVSLSNVEEAMADCEYYKHRAMCLRQDLLAFVASFFDQNCLTRQDLVIDIPQTSPFVSDWIGTLVQ
jgi:hypothetical protein